MQVFEYFVEKFGLDSHQSCFIYALELLLEMCKIWASKAQFLGHFGPQSKKHFWCLVTFSKLSLVSQQYCFTCSFQILLDVWRIWASEAQFLGHFGPPNKSSSGLWSFSKIFRTGCASVLVYMSIWATFRGVLNIGLRDPMSGHFGPQIDNNSGHFIKYFPMVSHHSRFTCLLGVLLCVFQLCAPKALFRGLELRLQWSLLCHQASCTERVTYYIITSSNENVFCVTVPLWEESTGHRWIPFTKGR